MSLKEARHPHLYWLLPLLCGAVSLSSCSACSTSLTRSDTDVYCWPVSRYLVWTKLSTKLVSKPICSTVCTTGESKAEEAARPLIISGRVEEGRNEDLTDQRENYSHKWEIKHNLLLFAALNALRPCWPTLSQSLISYHGCPETLLTVPSLTDPPAANFISGNYAGSHLILKILPERSV